MSPKTQTHATPSSLSPANGADLTPSSASSTSASSASSSPSKSRSLRNSCHSNRRLQKHHQSDLLHPLSPHHISIQPQPHSHQSSSQHFQISSSPVSTSIIPAQLIYSAWAASNQPAHHISALNLVPTSSSFSNSRNDSHSREGQPNNSTRRSSTNTPSFRHQQQQAQVRAQQAQVHQAQVQAQVQQLQAQVQAQQISYYQQHTAELAAYITQVFLPSVLPTPEEYQLKEQTRQYLETLADQVSKGARLLPFGSIASGLALRNSDMDLCCLVDPVKQEKKEAEQFSPESDCPPKPPHPSAESHQAAPPSTTSEQHQASPKPTPSEMVMILGQLIQEKTAFMVKMLPKARIPIIKLSLPPSPGQPFGLTCDIGFENRLALENTRLLLTYAMVDPRMRTMVLFLKVWTKRRRINDPYLGTLSSYGYVLMVIYYLVNGRKTAVLPNLQTLPPPRATAPEELVHDGYDTYFFDDLDALPRYWTGMNRENVGELLIAFFRFFSSTFRYTHDVISIRSPGGLLTKENKGWMHDIIEENKDGRGGYTKVDLNRLCIEDPFQNNYNVARTVTRDGLFTIRGEFMRAVRVLSTRTDRLDVMIRELCEERQEGVLMAPPSSSGRRKSAPSPKPALNMSQPPQINTFRPGGRNWSVASQGTNNETYMQNPSDTEACFHNDPNEEDEDEMREQLLLHQQQQQQQVFFGNTPMNEHQSSYPRLTTQLMQDHIYSQASSSTDARPRYPPESIASEPAILDRDLEWNRESINNYLSKEIQQLQLQQLQENQSLQTCSLPSSGSTIMATRSPGSCEIPPSIVGSASTFNPSNSTTSSTHNFHRFFQTSSGSEVSSTRKTSPNFMTSSQSDTSPQIGDQSTSNRQDLNLEPVRDQGDNPSQRNGAETSSGTSKVPSQPSVNDQRPNHRMSFAPLHRRLSQASSSRRKSEQVETLVSSESSWEPLGMTNSVHGIMPDFSSLPTTGPIRFGNFGTAEMLLKQKMDHLHRSGNIPTSRPE